MQASRGVGTAAVNNCSVRWRISRTQPAGASSPRLTWGPPPSARYGWLEPRAGPIGSRRVRLSWRKSEPSGAFRARRSVRVSLRGSGTASGARGDQAGHPVAAVQRRPCKQSRGSHKVLRSFTQIHRENSNALRAGVMPGRRVLHATLRRRPTIAAAIGARFAPNPSCRRRSASMTLLAAGCIVVDGGPTPAMTSEVDRAHYRTVQLILGVA